MTHLPSSTDRVHGFDALRGLALIAGIALHLSMTWLPGADKFWITHEDGSVAAALMFWLFHTWRMLVFFVLAGYFGRMLFMRLGPASFLRDRARRIALPLFAGWPMVFAAIVVVIVWSAWLATDGNLPKEPPPGPKFTPDGFPLTHLWFLWVLLLGYAALLLGRGLLVLIDRRAWLPVTRDRSVAFMLQPGGVVLLALPTAWALATHPNWVPWFGIPTPDQSLYPNLAACLAYGSALVFGWALQADSTHLEMLKRRSVFHGVVGTAAAALALLVGGLEPLSAGARIGSHVGTYAALYAMAGWSFCLAALGLSLRAFSKASSWRRELADASYWMYLAHLPLVMAAHVVCREMNAPMFVEAPLAFALVIGALWLSWWYLVRGRTIGRWLNGGSRAGVATAPAAVTVPAQ